MSDIFEERLHERVLRFPERVEMFPVAVARLVKRVEMFVFVISTAPESAFTLHESVLISAVRTVRLLPIQRTTPESEATDQESALKLFWSAI